MLRRDANAPLCLFFAQARIVRYGEGLEAELGSPQDDVEDRAAQLRRRLQSDRAQALKREKEQQMWDAQAREQQINLIRKRVIGETTRWGSVESLSALSSTQLAETCARFRYQLMRPMTSSFAKHSSNVAESQTVPWWRGQRTRRRC